MEITGKNFIGDKLSALGKVSYKTVDPLKNIVNEILFVEATSLELEEAVALADAAFPIYREMSGAQRTSFLNAIADEILNLGDALIDIYCRETGLPQARAMGERSRTIFQLQLFAKQLKPRIGERISTKKQSRKNPIPKPSLSKTSYP